MPPPTPNLTRDFLFIANFWVFIACIVYFGRVWDVDLNTQVRVDSTSLDELSDPARHTLSWYGTASLQSGIRALLIAFPYFTGAMFSLAALLTFSNVRPMLHTAPSRPLHFFIVFLCLAAPILLTAQRGKLEGLPVVLWCTAGLPAPLSLLIPALRRHTYRIVGFASGVYVFALGLFGSPMLVVIGFAWAYTAAFAWFDEPAETASPSDSPSPSPTL